MIDAEINLLLNSGGPEAKKNYLIRLVESTDLVSGLMKSLLNGPDTSFCRSKVDSELKRIMESSAGFKVTFNNPGREIKKVAKYDSSALPDPLKETHEQILSRYSSNRIARGRLQQIHWDTGGNRRTRVSPKMMNEAAELAMEIITSDKIIAQLYSDIDYFLDTVKLRDQISEATEISMLRNWLSIQVETNNYLAKSETFMKKNGRYQNPERVEESRKILSDIQNYLANVSAK